MRQRARSVLGAFVTLAALAAAAVPATAEVPLSPWPGSPFEQPGGQASPGPSAGLAAIDLNDHPWPDLFATLRANNGGYPFGSPTFERGPLKPLSVVYPAGTAGADIDGDGRLDAYVWGETDKAGGPSTIVRGTASGPVEAVTPSYASPILDAALADVTGDGRVDAIASERSTISVRPGRPGPTFSVAPGDGAFGVAAATTHVAAADVTADGRADVLVAIPGTTSAGTVSLRTAPALAVGSTVPAGGTVVDLFLADVAGDDRPEAVVVTTTAVRIHPVSGSGQLGTAQVIPTGSAITGAQSAVGDLNGDGDADLLLTTTATDRIVLLESDGTGGFRAPQAVPLPGGTRRAAVDAITTADLDADGDRDIAVSSDGAYRVDVLVNGVVRPPIVTTESPTEQAFETARLHATADLRGAGGTVRFEYGETTAYGRTTPEETLPPAPSAGAQPVSAALTGLQPERTYHARVVATNAAGTTSGADVEFRTTAAPTSDLTVAIDGPDLTVSGHPRPFAAVVQGSFGPFTYGWNFGDGTAATEEKPVHAFAPLLQKDGDGTRIRKVGSASDAGEAGTRRGSYVVTLTVTDRFGRTAAATKPTTVVPNRAPITSITALKAPLEYAEQGRFASGSQDPDAPLDAVAREDWTFGEGSIGTSTLTRDPGPTYTAPSCASQGLGKPLNCTEVGQVTKGVAVNPWRDDRRGLAPIAALPAIAPEAVKGSAWPAWNQQQKVMARALALYPAAACGAQVGSMAGCWPHKTVEKVRLKAIDRGGRDVTVEQDVPIRLRAKPAADVSLNTPKSVGDEPGPIVAGRPDADTVDGRGTELTFDPGTTIIDGDEEPVWYSVEIGTPWQESCKDPSPPQPTEPGIEKVSKETLSTLPPIDQLTGGDPNVLAGIESKGLSQKALTLARRSAMKTKGFAPAVGSSPVGAPGLGAGVVPKVKTTIKTPCLAGFGVNGVVAAVTSRDLATKPLTLTIPTPGTYSALLTVYDRTAATGKVRLDGIEVLQGQFKCANVSRSMGAGKDKFNWSGTCVDGSYGREVYWTQQAIDVNGVRVAPPDGAWMVVENDRDAPKGVKRGLVYTSSTVPASNTAADIAAWKPKKTEGKASILLDDQVVAQLAMPRGGDAATRFQGPKVVQRPAASGARYGGLPIATDVTIDFTAACKVGTSKVGGSQVDFEVRLPSDFNAPLPGEPAVPATTKPVSIPACNPLDKTVITKVTDTGNYKRMRAARVKGLQWLGTRRQRAGMARRAVAGVPNPQLDLTDVWLGPVHIEQFKLRYDDASKTFSGFGNGTVLEKKVTVRIIITDGQLTEAGGTVNVDIPLGSTPLLLKQLGFKLIRENGITLQGTAKVTTTDGVLVAANGSLKLATSPVKMTLDGSASLAGGVLPLGQAHVEVGDGKALVQASTGNSIGPFSYAVNVSGAFSSSAFNVEGSGRACVFACLGINGVLSSKGIAVCGEIDLWVHTFRPGFGYLYKGQDLNGYLDGCGLGPYRAVVGRLPIASGGTPPGSATKADLAVREMLTAGQSQPIDVEAGQTMLTLVARGKPGAPPKVTMTGPAAGTCPQNACAASGVVRTPAGIDDYGFDQTTNSVVDVDRVRGEVRFAIANPRSGRWTLAADPGSETVTGVGYARDQELPSVKAFGTSVAKIGPKDRLATKTYGGMLTSTTKPVATAKRMGSGIGAKTVITGSRIAKGAIGPAQEALLRKVTVDATALPAGDTISFVERGAGTGQAVVSYTVPGSGKLKTQFAFLPAVGGGEQRSVDAFITSPSGIPRGVVHDIDAFKASPAPRPKAPKISSLRAVERGKVQIAIKDEPAYGTKSSMPVMQVVLRRRNHGVTVLRLTGEDFRRQGETWVATARAGGDTAGAKVEVTAMAATGGIAKGAGRKVHATVKRR